MTDMMGWYSPGLWVNWRDEDPRGGRLLRQKAPHIDGSGGRLLCNDAMLGGLMCCAG